jgi:dipeptidyl aminopeptidase/acylaminoacyl peptidase
MRSAVRIGLAAVLLVAPALSAQQPSSQTRNTTTETVRDRLTLADYLEWEQVAAPELSPDGKQIVFARRWVDKLNDRQESSLYIMNVDGTRPRALLTGSSPRWSPDGTRIAYTAQGEPRGTQIFVRWMDAEGATTQITRLTESPSDIVWTPDGKSIVFRMMVPNEGGWRVEGQVSQFKPRGATWTASPRVVEKLNYRRDGSGFTSEGTQQIFIVPADGGTPRQITSGEWSAGTPELTPDGRTILFSAGPRVEDAEYQWRETEIYAVDVASGTIRQLTRRRGPDNGPAVSPDGKSVAYTGYDWSTDTWVDSKLYVMNIDGTNPRVLTPDLDRSPGGLIWAPDGTGIYFEVNSEGASNVYFASLDGKVRPITQGKHMLSVDDIGTSGLAVGTLSSPKDPPDLISFDLRRPTDIRTLTDVNGDVLHGKKLGDVEEIWYTSVDNFRIQGWIVKPPDFDPSKKYPLMLSIHGGPHSMYGVGFNFGWQEHAANGYVVLYTNPRGSTGYGSAFGNAIKNAYPSKDYDDLMKGVDEVIAKGYIDTDNMFVYGCSGGGVLTAWIVGHTDRFAAASANCPVTNWLSFVGTTDGSSWYRNFEKLPWEDPSEHLRRSPLMYVGNVKTPTMLMTGVNDLRTPMGQTEEFYEALKVLKVPTAMVRFNDEWHGTSSKPSNFIRTQLYLRDWFTKHARNKDRPRAEDRTR